jgi:hypothetical protein
VTAPLTPDQGALDRTDYLEVFGRVAHFLSTMQVDDPLHPHFGGMREGEHMLEIIQTDNTSEAIWIWSRYYDLTGDDQYLQNILDAFTYSMNFPAYLEEGGSSSVTGYYRMYNCGWATRAELEYRQVFGDVTYQAYGDSCARYIVDHYLQMVSDPFYGGVNPPVYSWALGNLYHVGIEGNHPEWATHAAEQAGITIKRWVEFDPGMLGRQTWAMAGGATMWGLLESYFQAVPDSLEVWMPRYKDEMSLYSSNGQFVNAWNGWYALGHHATAVALADPYHAAAHLALADTLVAEDGDLDGGIPAHPSEPDTQDQSWVSSYLAFMGLNPLLGPAAGIEVSAAIPPPHGLRLVAGPNPASSAVRLTFAVDHADDFVLAIYGCNGRRVAGLGAGHLPRGSHTVSWSGRDEQGRPVASGTYWAVLRTSSAATSQKILWLR